MLAVAITEVAAQYDIVPDPKTVAWVGLFTALGSVYGARFAAYKLGKKVESAVKNDGEIKPGPMAASAGGPRIVQMGSSGFPIDLPAVNA